jgi:spore coat protein CotH
MACTNSMETVNIPVRHDRCYFYCNVTLLHSGPCKCPSFCYPQYTLGICGNGKCNCNPGWKGRDCSLVSCPVNDCSKNGQCVQSSEFGDYCQCKPGYTGVSCASESFKLKSSLPYGELVTDRRTWYDEYKDDHPIFNISTHAFIQLKCPQEQVNGIYDSWTMWDNNAASCQMVFNNGNVKKSFQNVRWRIKGTATRMALKKGFKIFFDDAPFYGMHQIGLKTADPALIRSFITFEMYRALNIPVQRSSFATLYVNDISMGVYWMTEEVTEEWVKARYPKGEGTLYKCGLAKASLAYIGDDVKSYSWLNDTKFNGRYFGYVYKKEFGTNKFRDFVKLVQVLDKNITSDPIYPTALSRLFNVDLYIRTLMLEVLTGYADGYTLMSNNMYLYNDDAMFETIPYDYDATFEYDAMITGEYTDWADVNIYKWGNFSKRSSRSITYAPLTLRTLQVKEWRDLYTRWFHVFLQKVFRPDGILVDRIKALRDYLLPFVGRDGHFVLSDPVRNQDTFRVVIDQIIKYIGRRHATAIKQLL